MDVHTARRHRQAVPHFMEIQVTMVKPTLLVFSSGHEPPEVEGSRMSKCYKALGHGVEALHPSVTVGEACFSLMT